MDERVYFFLRWISTKCVNHKICRFLHVYGIDKYKTDCINAKKNKFYIISLMFESYLAKQMNGTFFKSVIWFSSQFMKH